MSNKALKKSVPSLSSSSDSEPTEKESLEIDNVVEELNMLS